MAAGHFSSSCGSRSLPQLEGKLKLEIGNRRNLSLTSTQVNNLSHELWNHSVLRMVVAARDQRHLFVMRHRIISSVGNGSPGRYFIGGRSQGTGQPIESRGPNSADHRCAPGLTPGLNRLKIQTRLPVDHLPVQMLNALLQNSNRLTEGACTASRPRRSAAIALQRLIAKQMFSSIKV